jgi:hypothetical protein
MASATNCGAKTSPVDIVGYFWQGQGPMQNAVTRCYNEAFKLCMAVVERDVLPDAAIRRGIRYLLSQRVKQASS